MWARAAGAAVAANARPRSFARGVLTVECASSIWANELTYLGGQLLARMTELDPAHPVRRFRFVTRAAPAPDGGPRAPRREAPEAVAAGFPGTPSAGRPAVLPTGSTPQENEPAASKTHRRDEAIDPAALGAAGRRAAQVGDERLRRAILAALAAAADEPPELPPGGPSVNRKR